MFLASTPRRVTLLVLCVGPACGGIAVLEEGEGGAGGTGVTTGTNGPSGPTSVSSSSSSTSQSGSSQTGMADPCQAPVGAPCDPSTFPSCELVAVSGIPCCSIAKVCDASGVGWEGAFCTDDCLQDCQLVTNPEHCEAVPWCVLGPMGCEFAPPPP